MFKNISKVIKLLSYVKGSGKDVIQLQGLKISGRAEKISVDRIQISINRETYEEALKIFEILGIENPIDIKIDGSFNASFTLEGFELDMKNDSFNIANLDIQSNFENVDVQYNADIDMSQFKNCFDFINGLDDREVELEDPQEKEEGIAEEDK